MLFHRKAFLATAGLATGGMLLSAGPAAAITVDGNLADWNVSVVDTPSGSGDNPAVNHNSVFTNVNATPGINAVFVEDTNDRSNNYFVGPNYGGQNYDVEFMAAAIQGTTLYLAMSSGLRPDNGAALYGPGDIRIVVNGTTKYGIEVGGGAGHSGGPAAGAIAEGANGTNYTLDGNGYTTGSANAAAAQKAGTIWKDVTWINDPIPSPTDEVQFQINGASTQVGTADYAYTRDSATTQHSFIELALDLSWLLGGNIANSVLSITWGPSCGNDVGLVVATPEQGDIQTPSPAALPLFLLGLAGLAGLRRRKAG